MAEYHKIYKGPEGETTQWDDIQVRLGNKAPPPPKHKPDAFVPEQEVVKNAEWLESKDEQELSDLEDEFDDDRQLEELRRRRIEEMRSAAAKPRFGSLEFIRAADFQRCVTDRSATAWVVVLLFQERHEGCTLLMEILQQLSERFPHNAFVKIISTECIPNYPDANLPTVLVYREGKCVKTIAGLNVFGGKRASPEQVTLVLNQVGPICKRADEDGEGPELSEIKGLVKRMVLQRQQAADEDDEDPYDSA